MNEAWPAGINLPNVSAWLLDHVPAVAAPFHFHQIAGGHSNLTYLVSDASGKRVVLRRPPLGHVLASAHDMRREHLIVSSLASTAVPVAATFGLCDDTAVNGEPFYVMDFVDGIVVRDAIAAEALSETARDRAATSLVETLAAIHAVDVDAAGLGNLGKREDYVGRQLRRWYGQWNQQKTRHLPAIDRVHDRLAAHIPAQGQATIVHGDYRLDNCMVDASGNIVAVLDWELCTLGDPLADLGLLLAYWTGPSDEPSAWSTTSTTSPGFPNRDEVARRYAAASGRNLDEIGYYVAFAYWKLACILEGVYARYLGGALGERNAAELAPFARQVEAAAAMAEEALL